MSKLNPAKWKTLTTRSDALAYTLKEDEIVKTLKESKVGNYFVIVFSRDQRSFDGAVVEVIDISSVGEKTYRLKIVNSKNQNLLQSNNNMIELPNDLHQIDILKIDATKRPLTKIPKLARSRDH